MLGTQRYGVVNYRLSPKPGVQAKPVKEQSVVPQTQKLATIQPTIVHQRSVVGQTPLARQVSRPQLVPQKITPNSPITQKGPVSNRVTSTKPVKRALKRAPSLPERRVQRREQKSVVRRRNAIRGNHNSPAYHSKKEKVLVKNRKRIQTDLQDRGVGRFLIIMACGPSLNEIDTEKLKHPKIDIMSINKPDQRIYPPTYWAFCDNSQYRRNKDLFEGYKGILINANGVRARHRYQYIVRNLSGKGFSRDLSKGYYVGRSTTYANMQTAAYMNYDRVFLLGVDMCKVGESMHYYGVNPDVAPSVRLRRFAQEAENYLHGAKLLSEEERSRFVFCSGYNEWEFTKYFRNIDHKNAVAEILKEVEA